MPFKKPAAKKVVAKKAPVKTSGAPRGRAAAPAKKAAPQRAPAKKAAPVRRSAASASGITPLKEKLNQSQLLQRIADDTEVDRKVVKTVMEAFQNLMAGAACKKGAGEFVLPGWFKVVVVDVPAKPKRKGINPFTGEEQVFAAKPATVKIKVRPLAKLKAAALG